MTPEIHVAVGILLDDRQRVLIAKRPEGKHMAGYWEFPGGKIAESETRGQALVRELQEELGVTPRYLRFLNALMHDYPDRRVCLHVSLVLSWDGVPAGLEGQALKWMEVSALLDFGLLPADAPIVECLHSYFRNETLPQRLD